ncbi:hypothetical protein PC110_g18632 [Phytophthora cactorum]|uniref:Uncharacterized protein n=1 Tax=Phytophthora cactorum TaxID=29920 RepID=A0A329RNM5_9STRA|nr:hypothetical protein PC117_g18905 [Phytophthora cactorum]RAW24952.1 hypothetical protein PC110_g18632 [Phytophthora cactorum]
MGGCPTEVGARQNGALCGLSMNSYKFYSYALNGPRDEDTNEKNFQLEISENLSTSSVFPRNAHYKHHVRDDEPVVQYAEHRELYKRKYGSGTQEENGGSSSSSSPPVEAFDASEAELSVSCGEEVSEQAKQSLAESILHKEADALFDKWIDLRVEWVEVAKKQYVTKEERNEVVGKLYMALPDGKRVWNVECLCQYINLHQWFPDTGKQSFPTIALARACLAVALLIDSLSRKGVLDRIFCYEPASH